MEGICSLTLNVIVSKQIFLIRGSIQYFIACKSMRCANDGIIARQSSLKKEREEIIELNSR